MRTRRARHGPTATEALDPTFPLSSAPVPAASETLGQLAALGTASCWAFSALAFAAAGRRMGVLPLNLIRLVIALGFLILATWGLRGLPLPVDASPRAWGWLSDLRADRLRLRRSLPVPRPTC